MALDPTNLPIWKKYGEPILRVPPLIVIDEIFRCSFGFHGKFFDFTPWFGRSIKNNEPDPIVGMHTMDMSNKTSLLDRILPLLGEIWTALGVKFMGTSESGAASGSSSKLNVETIINSQSSQTNTIVDVNLTNLLVIPDDFIRLMELIICVGVFVGALVVLFLSTKHLLKFYSYMLIVSVLILTFFLPQYIPGTMANPKTNSNSISILTNLVIRLMFAMIYYISLRYALDSLDSTRRGRRRERVPWIHLNNSFIYPLVFLLTGYIRFDPIVYVFLLGLLHYQFYPELPNVFNFLKSSWRETQRIRNEYGISHLIQTENARLNTNMVFRLFWLSRAASIGFYTITEQKMEVGDALKTVLLTGTETITCIIGLTFTVSAICHQIGAFLIWLLYWGQSHEADVNRFGSISTVLFLILSLQTGITTLDHERRLDRLFKNIVLLGTALFHALHQLILPLLHAFRTFRSIQIRAVALSLVFLLVSVVSTLYLYKYVSVSTWSLAVIALGLEFIIKITISLLISVVVYLSQRVEYPETFLTVGHFLRSILPKPAFHRLAQIQDETSNEDVIFYLKATSHVAEFITGIFLFGNACWIFVFESASAIRAIGMGIHAYFNIWCEGKKGIRVYRQRRTASHKIDSLADASPAQLTEMSDDVCAICYENMESAKVTKCNHFFHCVCLRRWLYHQNHCPLCHEILYEEHQDVAREILDNGRNEDEEEQDGTETDTDGEDEENEYDEEASSDADDEDGAHQYELGTIVHPVPPNTTSQRQMGSSSTSLFTFQGRRAGLSPNEFTH